MLNTVFENGIYKFYAPQSILIGPRDKTIINLGLNTLNYDLMCLDCNENALRGVLVAKTIIYKEKYIIIHLINTSSNRVTYNKGELLCEGYVFSGDN